MPSDTALAALHRAVVDLPCPGWWFAGEQDAPPPAATGQWQVFTNRCDTGALFERAGYAVSVDDFDLPGQDALGEAQRPQSVVYRVSKEKAQVHYLINQAARALALGGTLLLSGYKGDGLKTYADKAARLLGSKASISKEQGGAYLARINKRALTGALLPDQDYPQLRTISETPPLLSKPGIFGWQKLDRGSVLLIETLPAFVSTLNRAPARVADLGCGYGYLTLAAAEQLPECEWLLTDNNATALQAAQANCAARGIAGRCELRDCAQGINDRFEALLCNPPFHQGFATEDGLTDRFLAAAQRLLLPGGAALFVVNEFIPLQRKAQGLFARSELLLRRDGFCVIALYTV